MNMKKLVLTLSVIIAMVIQFSPQAKAQQLCDAGMQYVIGNVTPNGASVAFYDSSYAFGTITSWSWSFGNGTGSTLQNPTGFLNPGLNIVCLTITAIYQNQTCTSTVCDSIYIGTTPPSCNAVFAYTTSPLGVQFSGPSGSAVSWSWDFGDGTTSTSANPLHTYTAPGTYYVCLTVTDATGATCTDCQFVNTVSGPGCQAYFSATPIQGTTGFSFTDLSQGNATYFVWSFGDGTSSTLQNPTHMYNSTGPFLVCLTITDSAAGCSDTYCDSILVGTGVLCDPTFGYQTSPAGTGFYAAAGNNVSYSWDFGDGSVATGGPNITHVYTSNGTYTACLTVTTSNGLSCTSCQTITITNSTGCSSNFAIYPDSILLHTYYAYNLATGVGPLTYTWSWGDGTSSNTAYPSHTYAQGGLYTICLTITDATGCSSNTCYQWQLLRLASSVPVTINVLAGTTGMNEQPLINVMDVYPNPVADVINTSFDLTRDSEIAIRVLNLSGQTVYSIPSTFYGTGSHEIKMDASGLAKGMYLVEIQSEGFKSNRKIVVQ